jgi:hypothetical protein
MATKKKSVKKKTTKNNIKEKPSPFMQFLSAKPVNSKKIPSTKKKTTVKKKATKKAVKKVAPTKRYFLVEIGGRGGELVVGRSTEEFVQHWKGRDGDLADHMSELLYVSEHLEYSPDDEDFEYPEGYDKDSPTPDGLGLKEYYTEYDDIEHETMASDEDHSYTVSEIKLDSDAEYSSGELSWKDGITDDDDFDWSRSTYDVIDSDGEYYAIRDVVYRRELFIDADKTKVDNPVPVIMMYDAQKGTFGQVVVETNGEDFDHKKFRCAVIESSMGQTMGEFFYEKQSLSLDTSNLFTDGKGFFATVGYLDKQDLKFNRKAWIKEGFKDLDSE